MDIHALSLRLLSSCLTRMGLTNSFVLHRQKPLLSVLSEKWIAIVYKIEKFSFDITVRFVTRISCMFSNIEKQCSLTNIKYLSLTNNDMLNKTKKNVWRFSQICESTYRKLFFNILLVIPNWITRQHRCVSFKSVVRKIEKQTSINYNKFVV